MKINGRESFNEPQWMPMVGPRHMMFRRAEDCPPHRATVFNTECVRDEGG
jgi:hypothetical protein